MTVFEDLSIERHLENLLAAEVGEIIFNCVHKDGTLSGPDLNILNKISDKVTIPLVAIGGVSSLKDIKDTIDAGADAVAAGIFCLSWKEKRCTNNISRVQRTGRFVFDIKVILNSHSLVLKYQE